MKREPLIVNIPSAVNQVAAQVAAEREPRHVDDFIDDPASDPYAASWFEAYRRPAIDKARKPDERKLFATWKGSRYRVTGCSRMGDVWLDANFSREWGYTHRVGVDECSAWSATPEHGGDPK